MKKIILFLILFLNFFTFYGYSYYTPTQKDKIILNKIYKKIDLLHLYNNHKSQEKIKYAREKHTFNDRLDYLLENTYNYLLLHNNNHYYKLLKVVDWDTIKILYNWKPISVRMIWEDSPESYKTRFWYTECYWKQASNYLKHILSWKRYVYVLTDYKQSKFDKYWRLLWYVYSNNLNLNKLMIRNWYAWEYTYNKPYMYQRVFKNSEKLAAKKHLWLWAKNTCNWKRVKVSTKQKSSKITKKIRHKTTKQKSPETTKQIKHKTTKQINSEHHKQIKHLSLYPKVNCKTYKTCSRMSSCEEAKAYLYQCNFKRLDGDGDWIPCERLCSNKKHLWLWAKNTSNWKRIKISTKQKSSEITKKTKHKTTKQIKLEPHKQTKHLLLYPKVDCKIYKTCSRMSSCEEAKAYLYQCNFRRLDGDGDWVPCERLCSK